MPISRRPLRYTLAAAALVLATQAGAQNAPSSAGNLALPENPNFFGKNDPNHRKATVVVNGEIITGTDIDQRVALLVAASGGKIADEELSRLKLQVLRNLMDETLQIQEAAAQKIDVEQDEVEQAYTRIASQNFGQNPAAMEAYLSKIGSSPASLKRQIRGELSWQRLLRRNVQPFVNVSDDEVREVLKRMQDAKGTEEYRVGEIFLSATDENKPAVFENANQASFAILNEYKPIRQAAGHNTPFSLRALAREVSGSYKELRTVRDKFVGRSGTRRRSSSSMLIMVA